MPQYLVEFRRSAEKDLRRLKPSIQARVLRAIDALANNPRPNGCCKLIDGNNAFYTISDAVLIVAIESIRYRREAYR
jgi:mRNA interferase RelE/StbE